MIVGADITCDLWRVFNKLIELLSIRVHNMCAVKHYTCTMVLYGCIIVY